MKPKILIATLCLNEMEHLPRLYEQHKGWPGLVGWVFVESADRVYAETNPRLVTDRGLSVDGTTEWLRELASKDSRVVHLPYGFSEHTDPAQGKVASRQQYLSAAEDYRPDFVVVLDADEYYTQSTQEAINKLISLPCRRIDAFLFRQRHIWRPECISNQPLFQYEVCGGYWSVPHCRVWRWSSGLHYSNNHNTPCDRRSMSLEQLMKRFDQQPNTPECIHLGFASSMWARKAKHNYYVHRGEGSKDKRQWYVECRAAFETWLPNDTLPHGASVVPYLGEIPEVFVRRNPS